VETTLLIDGGLGRFISAIPALEKFVKKNPDTIIITYYWTQIYWGNKILRPSVIDSSTKGIFKIIKDTKIIKPEPYYNTNYLNNRISIVEAFNEEINGDNEKMSLPKIYLSAEELKSGKNIAKQNNKKLVVFQPFGQNAVFTNDDVIDNSIRSLSKKMTLDIIQMLKNQNFDIAFFDNREVPFLNKNLFLPIQNVDCRVWSSIIANCDYFIGCDSAGQHIARAFNIPGTVILGGTSEINTSYPDHFNIVRRNEDYSYASYRLADFDNYLSCLENSDLMNFTDEEILLLKENILKNLNITLKNYSTIKI